MAGTDEPGANGPSAEPLIVKKYANRRLYDTERSTYVTLADLAVMAREGREFVVRDARTDEDLTRSILVQIICESESRGENLLPIGFLRQLVGLYGDALQWAVPGYLESSMEVFSRNQKELRKHMEGALRQNPAMMGLEQLARTNRQVFMRTMDVFSPFGSTNEQAGASGGNASEIDEMRGQMAVLQSRLDKLAGRD